MRIILFDKANEVKEICEGEPQDLYRKDGSLRSLLKDRMDSCLRNGGPVVILPYNGMVELKTKEV